MTVGVAGGIFAEHGEILFCTGAIRKIQMNLQDSLRSARLLIIALSYAGHLSLKIRRAVEMVTKVCPT